MKKQILSLLCIATIATQNLKIESMELESQNQYDINNDATKEQNAEEKNKLQIFQKESEQQQDSENNSTKGEFENQQQTTTPKVNLLNENSTEATTNYINLNSIKNDKNWQSQIGEIKGLKENFSRNDENENRYAHLKKNITNKITNNLTPSGEEVGALIKQISTPLNNLFDNNEVLSSATLNSIIENVKTAIEKNNSVEINTTRGINFDTTFSSSKNEANSLKRIQAKTKTTQFLTDLKSKLENLKKTQEKIIKEKKSAVQKDAKLINNINAEIHNFSIEVDIPEKGTTKFTLGLNDKDNNFDPQSLDSIKNFKTQLSENIAKIKSEINSSLSEAEKEKKLNQIDAASKKIFESIDNLLKNREAIINLAQKPKSMLSKISDWFNSIFSRESAYALLSKELNTIKLPKNKATPIKKSLKNLDTTVNNINSTIDGINKLIENEGSGEKPQGDLDDLIKNILNGESLNSNTIKTTIDAMKQYGRDRKEYNENGTLKNEANKDKLVNMKNSYLKDTINLIDKNSAAIELLLSRLELQVKLYSDAKEKFTAVTTDATSKQNTSANESIKEFKEKVLEEIKPKFNKSNTIITNLNSESENY